MNNVTVKRKIPEFIIEEFIQVARPVLKGVEMKWPIKIKEIQFVTIEHWPLFSMSYVFIPNITFILKSNV
jgi:hypothetical protein